MLVVSDIDLTANVQVMKPATFLDASIKDTTVNLATDYRYMKTGYYVSLHAEILGNPVIPSCENIIDSTRTPILLLRAKLAGIPTLTSVVTDSATRIMKEIGFPALLFAVNPFIYDGYRTAANKSALYRALKSLGMNYKFDVCTMPLLGEMNSFKAIFGKCSQDLEIQKVAARVYEVFKIPICKLHVQRISGKVFLCGLQPVCKRELSPEDWELISKEVSLISEQGEPFVV